MSRTRATKQPFRLVVVDQDVDQFTVEGPMLDDTKWNKAVCEAQSHGRNIRCFSTSSDLEYVIAYQSKQGLTLVESGRIVQAEMPWD